MSKRELQRELDKLCHGFSSPYTVGELCDEISRLWGLGEITYDEVTLMSLQAINIISKGCMVNEQKKLS
jgi:hypothetical protein